MRSKNQKFKHILYYIAAALIIFASLSSISYAIDYMAIFRWNAVNGTDTKIGAGPYANINYGTANNLWYGTDGGNVFRDLVNWINTTKSIPNGSVITGVKMEITIISSFGSSSVTIYPVNSTWDEGNVTYNNINGCPSDDCYNLSFVVGSLADVSVGKYNITLNTTWYQKLVNESNWAYNKGLVFIGSGSIGDNEKWWNSSDNVGSDLGSVPVLYVNYSYTPASTPPDIVRISQLPSNISAFNLFTSPLILNYSISVEVGTLNTSTVSLNYNVSSPLGYSYIYINGNQNIINNAINYTSGAYIWLLNEYSIYPASYNLNASVMEAAAKTPITLSGINNFAKVRLYNMTDSANFSFFEVMANTSSAQSLEFWYCNSNYTGGNIHTSASCANFYNLAPSAYNHTHTINSSHQVIPLQISSKKVNGIGITSTAYFIMSPSGSGAWDIYKTSLALDNASSQYSVNNGASYLNASGTFDAHLHQYSDNTALSYFVSACNTAGNCLNGTIYYDALDFGDLSPSSPIITAPINNFTYNGIINITWTNSTAQQGLKISNYSVDFLNSSFSFISNIGSTTGNNISFDTSGFSGVYYFKVTAYDNKSHSSFGLSENISIDNQPPSIIFISPSNNSIFENSGSFDIEILFNDNIDLYDYSYNLTNTTGYLLQNNSGLISGKIYNLSTIYALNNTLSLAFILNARTCDSHTDVEIGNYVIDVSNTTLNYTFSDGYIAIVSQGSNAASTLKAKDRYSFSFNYPDASNVRNYEILTNYPIEQRKGSRYIGHFVIGGKYWLDFEGAIKADITYKDGHYNVAATQGVSSKTASYSSIGELNCVSSFITFTVAPPKNPYSTDTLKGFYWFDNQAVNTGTTAGVFVLFFLFGVLVFMIWLSEKTQIPFFALVSGVYGLFLGMLIYTIISAILGFLICMLGGAYMIRSLLMAR